MARSLAGPSRPYNPRMLGPVVRGEKVTLRPFSQADAETFVAWLSEPEVTRFILLRYPPTLDAEREWFDRMSRDAAEILWGIEYEGRLVGTSGVHRIDWANGHAVTGTLIGDREAWGKGVGGESMRLRTRYCFRETTLHKLNSSYLDGNTASGRAQVAAGYREIGRRREEYFRQGRWHDEVLTEVLREDWLKANPER